MKHVKAYSAPYPRPNIVIALILCAAENDRAKYSERESDIDKYKQLKYNVSLYFGEAPSTV